MTHANDNQISEEWLEFKAFNDRYAFFTKEAMLQFKHRPPSAIANMLWFAKFELSFRKSQAQENISVVK